jgi:hypothetical protein
LISIVASSDLDLARCLFARVGRLQFQPQGQSTTLELALLRDGPAWKLRHDEGR